MSTDDFIIALFWRVDAVLADVPKHPQARLSPSAIVTLALLFARKGVGPRAFYRWLHHNYATWFPGLPARTRLFRLFAAHQDWAEYLLAEPTVWGVADSDGIARRHPWRADRADQQIGGKGRSTHRWISGAKLVDVVNQGGLVVGWDDAAAHVPDHALRQVIADVQDELVILTDTHFHSRTGDPPNLKGCQRGTWNGRMVIETVLALVTTICQFKKRRQRTWAALHARRAFTMALFNLLVQWDGLPVDEDGNIHLSIAEFSL